jgi:hypothetical protein
MKGLTAGLGVGDGLLDFILGEVPHGLSFR